MAIVDNSPLYTLVKDEVSDQFTKNLILKGVQQHKFEQGDIRSFFYIWLPRLTSYDYQKRNQGYQLRTVASKLHALSQNNDEKILWLPDTYNLLHDQYGEAWDCYIITDSSNTTILALFTLYIGEDLVGS